MMKRQRDPTTRRARVVQRILAASIVTLLAQWSSSTNVQASGGDLDYSFGNSGRVTTDFPDGEGDALAVAIYPGGKILAAGSVEGQKRIKFALVRYNGDGSLDPTFGSGGWVTTDLGQPVNQATSMAIQSDGKIVVAGYTALSTGVFLTADFALVRYNTDGTLDPTFGSGGIVHTDFHGGEDHAWAVAIQSDGHIVAAGTVEVATTRAYFALARYNTDGSLDSSFGSGGTLTTDFSGFSIIRSIAIQPDDRIVVGGYADTTTTDFALARYNSDGRLDTSFGGDGKVTTDFLGDWDDIFSILIQPDGKIVAAGRAYDQQQYWHTAVARYNSDGTLDANFASSGKTTIDFSGSDSYAHSLVMQPDGRLVIVGGTWNRGSQPANDIVLARFNSDGNLDSTFGSDGKVVTDFFGGTDLARSAAIGPDGRIIISGCVFNGEGYVWALACYLTGTEEPDFALGFKKNRVTGTPGVKVKVVVRIARSGDFAGEVTITAPDASAEGIVPKFSEPVTTTESSVAFKFKVTSEAAPGSHQLFFVGKDTNGRVRAASMIVFVE
jgi:uncharacterized delta-60 repeat protein